jgi:oligopeptide transport system substrate-binding protein
LLCLSILFTFTACEKKAAKNADKKINYNLAAEPKTLDPQIASDNSSIIAVEALYEGLARLGSDGQPYPGVAEKWESNSDGTVFTFTLRSSAKWANDDKTPVTAADFVYAFQRALSPATGSKTCSSMFCIKNAKEVNSGALTADQLGVTAPDEHTLVVQLNYSYPDFPFLTASAVFMPCNQKFFEGTSGRYGLERNYLLSNGPFKIDGKYGWSHGKYLNLIRSDTYSGYQKPLPSNLKFTIGSTDTNSSSFSGSSSGVTSPDISDPVAALTTGTVDAIELPADKIDAATAAGCTLTSFQDTTWGLSFNAQSDYMKNLKIRKAFIQAFDRAAVIKHIPGNSSPAENIICPSTTFLGKNYRSLVTGSPFYLKQDKNAAALLHSGLAELSQTEMKSIDVICPDDPNAKLMLNEMIATWNAKFNDYFNMEPLDSDTLAQRVKSGSYQIALCSIRPSSDGPLPTLSLFKSGAVGNPAHLRDPAFDTMLADAQKKTGSAAVTAFASAEMYLNQQGIFYPLYYEKHYYAAAKGVTGVVFHPYGAGIDFIQAGKE